MISAKDKPKDKEKALVKPTSAFVTICHKDEKMIVGDCIYKYFMSKEPSKPILNFYYDQNSGKTSINLTKNDIMPQGMTYSYVALELAFGHAMSCPSFEFQNLKNCLFEKHKHYIGVAASGLIIDKNGKVLVTKRMPTMKSFPNAWVFPGGKVDIGESIEDTVLREIREETGISIEKESEDQMVNEEDRPNGIKCSHIRPFFLWESVYPTNLKFGLPQNQFIVIFFLIKLKKSCEEITVMLEENEVERCAWIDVERLYEVCSYEANITPAGFLNEMIKTQSNKNEDLDFPMVIFMDVYPNCFGEGLGEGHREALKVYAERKRKSKL